MWSMGRMFLLVVLILWVLISTASRGHCLPPEPRYLDRPAYPIYAIGSEDNATGTPTKDDLEVIAKNFRYIQGFFNSTTVEYMRNVSTNFTSVRYHNSHTEDAYYIEGGALGRIAVLCYQTGHLVKPLKPHDTIVHVRVDEDYSLIRASTEPGNASTPDTYVIFIRIEQELMKVTEVKTGETGILISVVDGRTEKKKKYTRQTLTVQRGFDRSAAGNYRAQTPVLAPVYNGYYYPGHEINRTAEKLNEERYSDHLADADLLDFTKDIRISYTIDPASVYASGMLIYDTLQDLRARYDGSWYDAYDDEEFRAVDMGGRPIRGFPFWNNNTGAAYMHAEFDAAQRARLAMVWRVLGQSLGSNPILLANGVNTFYFNGARDWLIANSTPGYRPLDGFCLENLVGTVRAEDGQYVCNAPSYQFNYASFDLWTEHMTILLNATLSNLAILPMTSDAGCFSKAMEEFGPERVKIEHFAYASFLLAVVKPDGPAALGIPAFYKANGTRYAHIDSWFFLNIGLPRESYPDLSKYVVSGHQSYRRYFTRSVIIVNPHNTTDYNIPLGGTYANPDSSQLVGVVDAAPSSGYIFIVSR